MAEVEEVNKLSLDLCRCRCSGPSSSRVQSIRVAPPAEPPSCGSLWEVDGTVGEPVYSSEHPTPALSHTGAHRRTQESTYTTDTTSCRFMDGRREMFQFAAQLEQICVFFRQEALQEFVLKQNRVMELHSLPDQVYILDENAFFNDTRLGKRERKRLNVNTALRKSLSFCLPGTRLSVDFFTDQVGEEVSMFRRTFRMVQLSIHLDHVNFSLRLKSIF